jgi:hypothetical protein
MYLQEHVEVGGGICQLRMSGECTLPDAVELITDEIAYCRDRGVAKLLVEATGLIGVSIPSLVDRFLIAEEWAQEAEGMVVVVLVVEPEYIHAERFGVRVAADFGLMLDVYTSEAEAMKWLTSQSHPASLAASVAPAKPE